MTTTTELPARHGAPHTTGRFLVTLRGPATRGCRPVGFLDCGQTYTFAYLRSEVQGPGFRPLLGLSHAEGPMHAAQLFPIFAEQIISPRRPDREQTLAALDLPVTAAPYEVLSRSGGRRVGGL